MRNRALLFLLTVFCCCVKAQTDPVDYVNPFIGTTNFGTTNPGAICPRGLMSVTPFNVMGSQQNKYDKDNRWWSTPYAYENSWFTGFSHVNLSGVGCPDMGSLLLMPTSGPLEVDYTAYGSGYEQEHATPGYYSNYLSRYKIKTEVSATLRTGISRFTFPKGEGHILLNLGEGLTNETGAMVRKVSETEIEGTKLLGTFCYTQNQAVFPIYFVMRIDKTPKESGYWKYQRPVADWEQEWNTDAGKYKVYTRYEKELAGDHIGAWFSFDCADQEQITVSMGVSFVSMENARKNLDAEQANADFDQIRKNAREQWNNSLSCIRVEGGSEDQKTIFYTALYHTMIHPNLFQDVDGRYASFENAAIKKTTGNRYTVFSLWDTYRNVHQLYTLLFPETQLEMVNTMIGMYKESGWLPKWELYGRESLTMEGDPSIPVIVDTWMKGLRGFDVETAYEAMYKSATTPGGENVLRPDNDDYMALGYVPITEPFDNSVSHALEYYIADWNLSQFARALGKADDAARFLKRSLNYKHYYCKDYGTFRPIRPDGTFYSPFDPVLGSNFEPNPGFHEGNAWNYTFAVPHDVQGLVKLMGGKKKFVDKLQSVFDRGYFDVTNEPDINYPHLFSEIKGEEWRTQQLVKETLDKHYANAPGGIPGNDDAGTLSAWAVFNMMGFYPACPGRPDYTLVLPVFDSVTISLDSRYYPSRSVTIRKQEKAGVENGRIKYLLVDGVKKNSFRITHEDLTKAKEIVYVIE